MLTEDETSSGIFQQWKSNIILSSQLEKHTDRAYLCTQDKYIVLTLRITCNNIFRHSVLIKSTLLQCKIVRNGLMPSFPAFCLSFAELRGEPNPLSILTGCDLGTRKKNKKRDQKKSGGPKSAAARHSQSFQTPKARWPDNVSTARKMPLEMN